MSVKLSLQNNEMIWKIQLEYRSMSANIIFLSWGFHQSKILSLRYRWIDIIVIAIGAKASSNLILTAFSDFAAFASFSLLRATHIIRDTQMRACNCITATFFDDTMGQFHQHFTRGFFCTKVLHAAFLSLHFRFVLYWRKTVGAKVAHRTLVKLTPCLPNNIK